MKIAGLFSARNAWGSIIMACQILKEMGSSGGSGLNSVQLTTVTTSGFKCGITTGHHTKVHLASPSSSRYNSSSKSREMQCNWSTSMIQIALGLLVQVMPGFEKV
jgi:hypothetical protein